MKKHILSVSFLMMAFAGCMSVYGTARAETTVGLNITTGGLLQVSGVASFFNQVLGPYFTATTTATSTLPRLSSSGASLDWLCLTGDTCRTTWPTSGGGNSFPWPWTSTTNFAAAANATSGITWFQNGFQASSTSQLSYASTTAVSGAFLCIGTDCRNAWPSSGSSGSSRWASTTNDSNANYNIGLGSVAIGTTTTNRFGVLTVASATPAIIITDTNGVTDKKHFGIFYNDGVADLGTANDAMTSTSSVVSIQPLGPGSLNVGSTTFSGTPIEGLIVQGRNGANGTTTTMAGEAQWDIYTTTGVRFCLFFTAPGVIGSSTGACNQ